MGNNINTDVDLILLAQDRDQQQDLENMSINFRGFIKVKNFLTRWPTAGFSRTMQNGVSGEHDSRKYYKHI
jgi:hypothetical protein